MDLMRQNVIQAVLTGLILFSALSCAMSNEISPCVDGNGVECVDFDNTENYCNVGQNISARVDIRLHKKDLELILYELERVSLVSIDKNLTFGNTVKDKTFGNRFQVAINIKPAEGFGKLEIQTTLENFKRGDTRLMHVDVRLKNRTISTKGKAFFPVQPVQTATSVATEETTSGATEETTSGTPNKKDDVAVLFQILQDMNNTMNALIHDRMDMNENTVGERDLWHLQENITKAVKQEITDWHQGKEEQSILKHVHDMCLYICVMITFIAVMLAIIIIRMLYLYMRRPPGNSTPSTGVSDMLVYNPNKDTLHLHFYAKKTASGHAEFKALQEVPANTGV